MLSLASPAKINLFLHVTGRRADGYHELFSLMSCISLCDRIRLEFGGRALKVVCSHPQVPADETNLAHRAAQEFFAACGRDPASGLRIRIDKHIPVAAGLGGGSSNAATVLMGLNAHYGFPLSAPALCDLGLSLGADVPFFLFGRPALAVGIGERLEAFDSLPAYWVVVVFPGFALSTAWVFSQLNLALTNHQKKPTKALLKKQGFVVPDHLHNDLETVALRVHPQIGHAKGLLAEQGALGVLMSGSGPSVFGLFEERQAAAKARSALGTQAGWKVYLAEIVTNPADAARELP